MYYPVNEQQKANMEELRKIARKQIKQGLLSEEDEGRHGLDYTQRFVILNGLRKDLLEDIKKRVFFVSGGSGAKPDRLGSGIYGVFVHDADSRGKFRRGSITRLATKDEVENALNFYNLFEKLSDLGLDANVLTPIVEDGIVAMRSLLEFIEDLQEAV